MPGTKNVFFCGDNNPLNNIPIMLAFRLSCHRLSEFHFPVIKLK